MPPSDPAIAAQFSSHRGWPGWFLVAAILLAYANALFTPFLFDDAGAVVKNPTIRSLSTFAVFAPPADGSTATAPVDLNTENATRVPDLDPATGDIVRGPDNPNPNPLATYVQPRDPTETRTSQAGTGTGIGTGGAYYSSY